MVPKPEIPHALQRSFVNHVCFDPVCQVRSTEMADDRSKQDFHDRDRVSGDQEYEVGYVASKFGLTIPEVRELVRKHGNDRNALEREAKAIGSR
jgi:hypothetical protein